MKYTEQYKGERFEDGRPKVGDKLLKKMDGLSAEEVWAVLPGEGYNNQYEGNFQILHPEKKLIGRAVTVQFMPARPDIKGRMMRMRKPRESSIPGINGCSTCCRKVM